MKTAAQLFLKHGFEGTSITEIAESSEISIPGIYYHFTSKQSLLAAIMNETMDDLERGRLEISRRYSDPEERLWHLTYDHALQITRADVAANSMLIIDATNALLPDARRQIAARKRAHMDVLREILDELKSEGKLHDVNTQAAAFTGVGMVLWLAKWYRPKGRPAAEKMAEEITNIVMQAMIRDDRRQVHGATHASPARGLP
jgi:AcrR family transcriptional regulator